MNASILLLYKNLKWKTNKPVKIDNLSDDEHNALRYTILPHEKTY